MRDLTKEEVTEIYNNGKSRTMGNLKGTAYSRQEYLYKKNHPILWKIKQLLRKLIVKLDKENEDLYYPNK